MSSSKEQTTLTCLAKDTAPCSLMAHRWEVTRRTDDVQIGEKINFTALLLSEAVSRGLQQAGFERPSPIQSKAIPLGRCGFDLVVQAKSGTGKTCVFAVVALESIDLTCSATQVLVLAPTREIAVQIQDVINAIGSSMTELTCKTFIGGLPVHEDVAKLKKCHIAVGTPGRLKQLIESDAFNTESVRLFVLDEADKLMEQNFQEDINWIYSTLPTNKQMMALSATYPESLARHITKYMRNPMCVRLNVLDPALLGVRQYSQIFPFQPVVQQVFDTKFVALIDLLSSVDFNQCLVFTNYQMRAQSLCDRLEANGWPAACISAAQDQHDRLKAMSQLKKFQCRILISTDLTARGIDAENVNLIVNFDVPRDHETYLHRVGRAGRFGTFGAAVSLVSGDQELKLLITIENRCHTSVAPLPVPIPPDLAKCSGYVPLDAFVTAERIATGDGCELTENDNTNQTSSGNPTLSSSTTGDLTDLPKPPEAELLVSNDLTSVESNSELLSKSEVSTILYPDLICETFIDKCKVSDASDLQSVVDELSKDAESHTIENCLAVDFDVVSFRDSSVLRNILENRSRRSPAQNSASFSDIVSEYHLHCGDNSNSSIGHLRNERLQARSVDLSHAADNRADLEKVTQFLAHSRFDFARRSPKCASLVWPTYSESSSTEGGTALPDRGSTGEMKSIIRSVSGIVVADDTREKSEHVENNSKRCSSKNSAMNRDELLSFRENKELPSPAVISRVDELQLRRTDFAPASKSRRNPKMKSSKQPENAEVPKAVQSKEQSIMIAESANATDKSTSPYIECGVLRASVLESNNASFVMNKQTSSSAVSSRENDLVVDAPSSINPPATFSKEELLGFRDVIFEPSPAVIAQVDKLQLSKTGPQTRGACKNLPCPSTAQFARCDGQESQDTINSKSPQIESKICQASSIQKANCVVESLTLPDTRAIEVMVPALPTDNVKNCVLGNKNSLSENVIQVLCEGDTAAVCAVASSSIVEMKTVKSAPVTKVSCANSPLKAVTDPGKLKPGTSVGGKVNESYSQTAESQRDFDFDKKILSAYVAAGFKDKLTGPSAQFYPLLQKKDSRQSETIYRHGKVPPETCKSSSNVTSSSDDAEDLQNSTWRSPPRSKVGKTRHELSEAGGFAARHRIRNGLVNGAEHDHKGQRTNETRRPSKSSPRDHCRQSERDCQNNANDFWCFHANGLNQRDPWWSSYPGSAYEPVTDYPPDCHSSYLLGARDAYHQMALHYESVRRQSMSNHVTSQRVSRLWQQQADYIREMARAFVDAHHR